MRIYRDFDRFLVFRVKTLLEEHGIPCFIKNEFVSGAIGEVSPFDSQPEVWLSDPLWEKRAKALIEGFKQDVSDDSQVEDWSCSHCGEVNAASFDVCWQCQHSPEETRHE
nr:DUF2007 domain-containing protein [Alteromonas facilis]